MTLAELIAQEGLSDIDRLLTRFSHLRRLRATAIPKSATATNNTLHLHDDADLQARARRLENFPTEFGWIHAFDVSKSLGTKTAGRLRN